MISSRYTMARTQFMKITITDNISLLRRITTIINSSLIIDFRTHIRYVTQFYHMVISMKQDSHAGRIIDVTFRDAVTHTIHIPGR